VEHRPIAIAGLLTFLLLALIGADDVRYRLRVPPMSREMQFAIARTCPIPDSGPVVPLVVSLPDRLLPHARNCDFSQRHPLRVSSDWLRHGGIIERVAPVYPAEAKHQHLQGEIPVRVLINKNGEAEQVCGFGPRLLRQAAEDAALQFRFRVPEINGERIPYTDAALVFNFVLDEPQPLKARP
jgi:hypothetical protein